MQQYHENNFKETIHEIGKLNTAGERSDSCDGEHGDDGDDYMNIGSGCLVDDGSVQGQEEQQQCLGLAGKGLVDVPDPPMETGDITEPLPALKNEDCAVMNNEDNGEGTGTIDETGTSNHDGDDGEQLECSGLENKYPVAVSEEKPAELEPKVPHPSRAAKKQKKVHHTHLFVKIPSIRNAGFETMVRRHRSFEHEAKVYSELLADLQAFVKTRVGDAVQLKIPTVPERSGPTTSSTIYQEDNHDMIVEDLTQKGFQAKDWFEQKLDHREITMAVDELAKFHACGLAYRWVDQVVLL